MPRQRVNDNYLMDIATDQIDFKEKEILYINIVWLYLQILTMTDIANSQGDRIIEGIKICYTNQETLIT